MLFGGPHKPGHARVNRSAAERKDLRLFLLLTLLLHLHLPLLLPLSLFLLFFLSLPKGICC